MKLNSVLGILSILAGLLLVVVFIFEIFFARGYYVDACIKAGETPERCEFKWIESRQEKNIRVRHY